jgi:DNA-binding MarR family transcriptional regulator
MARKANTAAKGRETASGRAAPDDLDPRVLGANGKLLVNQLDLDINEVLAIASDAQRALDRQLKRHSRKHSLTQRALYILGLIDAGLDRPSHLMEYFDVLPSTITVETDKLVEAALLSRVTDPNDRRSIRLALTPKGRKLHREAMELVNEMFRPRFSQLTEEELRICVGAMRKIVYPIDPPVAEAVVEPPARIRRKGAA